MILKQIKIFIRWFNRALSLATRNRAGGVSRPRRSRDTQKLEKTDFVLLI